MTTSRHGLLMQRLDTILEGVVDSLESLTVALRDNKTGPLELKGFSRAQLDIATDLLRELGLEGDAACLSGFSAIIMAITVHNLHADGTFQNVPDEEYWNYGLPSPNQLPSVKSITDCISYLQSIRATLRPNQGSSCTVRPEENSAQQAKSPQHGSKRSTNRGDAESQIISGLAHHHRYESGDIPMDTYASCTNAEPVQVNQFAREIGVAPASVSRVLTMYFGSHKQYCITCRKDIKRLGDIIQQMLGEKPTHGPSTEEFDA